MPGPNSDPGGPRRPAAHASRWQYPTTAARPAEKAAREEKRWAARYAAARTPAQVAAVDFDRLRAVIKDLARRDPAAADRRWAELSALLAKLRDVTSRDVRPRPKR